MIDHRTENDCGMCRGTGKVVQRSRGVTRTWPCGCAAGRSIAILTVTTAARPTGER